MKCCKFISLLIALLAATFVAHAQNAPCTGSEYSTNADFFRAYASALSSDVTASKKKAMVNARTTITNLVNAQAKDAAKSQSKISGADLEQFIGLVQIATRQKAATLKVICENSGQTAGKYKTHIVVELAKADVLKEIIAQINSDDKLKALFEEEKFKQVF